MNIFFTNKNNIEKSQQRREPILNVIIKKA